MSHPLTPIDLLTDAERAGYRIACERMRLHGARIETSGKVIGGEPVDSSQNGSLLTHCGKMIQVVADLTEDMLDYTPRGGTPTRVPDRG